MTMYLISAKKNQENGALCPLRKKDSANGISCHGIFIAGRLPCQTGNRLQLQSCPVFQFTGQPGIEAVRQR
jgi:hypothetical protein